MPKTIVLYYSKSGNNEFIANKISERINADIEKIRPVINLPLLLLFGLSGIKKIKADLTTYDRVILCGPIWMGKLIPPFNRFIQKYQSKIKSLIFVTCCGSSVHVKDEKYGHQHVFTHIEKLLGEKLAFCQALPITLILSEDQQENQEAIMSARLNSDNFKGEIEEEFKRFIKLLSIQ